MKKRQIAAIIHGYALIHIYLLYYFLSYYYFKISFYYQLNAACVGVYLRSYYINYILKG